MAEQLLTIARNTFIEAIRQPIFVVLIAVGLLLMLLNPQLAAYTMEDDNKLLIDLGLSTIFVVSLLLSAFTATGVLAHEIEQKTVLTVVSKPVARPTFVVGKFLGVAAAIAVAYYVLSLAFILTIRHQVQQRASDYLDQPVVIFGLLAVLAAFAVAAFGNYMYRWVFTSSLTAGLVVGGTIATALVLLIDKEWAFQSPLTEFTKEGSQLGQIIVGLLLIYEAVLLLTAVAIAASTRLGQIMTLVICVGVFFMGLISNSLSQWANERIGLTSVQAATIGVFESFGVIFTAEQLSFGSRLIYALAKLLYLALPNLQFLWPADAITQGNPFTLGHVATVTGYAVLYCTAVLAVAVILFQKREVG